MYLAGTGGESGGFTTSHAQSNAQVGRVGALRLRTYRVTLIDISLSFFCVSLSLSLSVLLVWPPVTFPREESQTYLSVLISTAAVQCEPPYTPEPASKTVLLLSRIHPSFAGAILG